jgi:hypothetical protein
MKSLLITMFIFSIIFNHKILSTQKESMSSKIKSTVNAVMASNDPENENFSYYVNRYFRKVFSFNSPVNKCVEENCEFCCLSLNFCGSKEQCENSNFTQSILKIMFFSLCFLLAIFLIYKIYITDPEPEHQEEDKVEEKTLNFLIGMFIHNRENRRKFKL